MGSKKCATHKKKRRKSYHSKKKDCGPIDPPNINIDAILPVEQIRPQLPLCKPWEVEFFFPKSVSINPQSIKAFGLYNISEDCCLQSVSSVCTSLNKTPDLTFLNQSYLCLPFPGRIGTITGEAYFFGVNTDYKVSLTPYLLEGGKKVLFLPKVIPKNISVNTPTKLIFTARLNYKLCHH